MLKFSYGKKQIRHSYQREHTFDTHQFVTSLLGYQPASLPTQTSKPPTGLRVAKPNFSLTSSVPSGGFISKLPTRIASSGVSSALASLCPLHALGPCKNVIKLPLLRLPYASTPLASSIDRSALNSAASLPHSLTNLFTAQGELRTVAPAGMACRRSMVGSAACHTPLEWRAWAVGSHCRRLAGKEFRPEAQPWPHINRSSAALGCAPRFPGGDDAVDLDTCRGKVLTKREYSPLSRCRLPATSWAGPQYLLRRKIFGAEMRRLSIDVWFAGRWGGC